MSKHNTYLVHHDGKIVYAKSYGLYRAQYALYRTRFDEREFRVVNTEEVTPCDMEVEFSTEETEPVMMYKYLDLLERVKHLERQSKYS